MILYLLKIILASSFFIFLYKLLLEGDSQHKAKRFYLMFTMILSLVIPFITLPYGNVKPIANYIESVPITNTPWIQTSEVVAEKTFDFWPILHLLYASVTCVLLFRFGRNLFRISHFIRRNPRVRYGNNYLVFVPEDTLPHSFFKYIFISKEDFKLSEILKHEQAHIQQKHSYDILLVEILKALLWINPAFYFYRKALLLNHEFLADEAVLETTVISDYQTLIFQFAQRKHSVTLPNNFNYSITKKRLIMMTKEKNPLKSTLKVLLAALLICPITYFLSEKVSAQTINKVTTTPKQDSKATNISTLQKGKGLSEKEMKEYENMVASTESKRSKGNYKNLFSPTEEARLRELYLSMTMEQQNKQKVHFYLAVPPLEMIKLTEAQYQTWKNDKSFYLTLDGKYLKNEDLGKYKISEIAYNSILNVRTNHTDHQRFKHKVLLYTYVNNTQDKDYTPNKFYLVVEK